MNLKCDLLVSKFAFKSNLCHYTLEVLTWLQVNGSEWDDWTPAYAAQGGQLETLQWLIESGCPYDERKCASAARSGNIEVLECAMGELEIECGEWTCACVAESGKLDMLKWLRERDIPWDEDVISGSCLNGHYALFRW
jgi:hypothetical protein